MNTTRVSKSRKIFIRREKARIRRNVLDLKEREKLINGLYLADHWAAGKAGKEMQI